MARKKSTSRPVPGERITVRCPQPCGHRLGGFTYARDEANRIPVTNWRDSITLIEATGRDLAGARLPHWTALHATPDSCFAQVRRYAFNAPDEADTWMVQVRPTIEWDLDSDDGETTYPVLDTSFDFFGYACPKCERLSRVDAETVDAAAQASPIGRQTLVSTIAHRAW